MQKLKINSNADLLSVLPFMIGFHVEDSLVVVAIKGSTPLFVARADLPERGTTEIEMREPMLHLAACVAANQVDGVIVLGYGQAVRVTPAVKYLSRCMTVTDVPVIDEVRVTNGRYWSYLCDDLVCCPIEGSTCPPHDSLLAVEATLAGAVALHSRKELEERLAPVTGVERRSMDEAEVRALARLMRMSGDVSSEVRPGAGRSRAGIASEQVSRLDRQLKKSGRAAVRAAEQRYRSGGQLNHDEMAWLLLVLKHAHIRDYAWTRSGTDDWEIRFWSDAVRRASPEFVAPPASLLAFIAWRANQGPLACIAVDRALDADADYSMALMMNGVLSDALPPDVVSDWPAIEGLDEILLARGERFDGGNPDLDPDETAGSPAEGSQPMPADESVAGPHPAHDGVNAAAEENVADDDPITEAGTTGESDHLPDVDPGRSPLPFRRPGATLARPDAGRRNGRDELRSPSRHPTQRRL
ncbi:DUF4192 domain-containing protein [Winogradskya humida]|uniref:DUF4192 domain-containing protein n=1 Tax=Winogradskya humida TaxID=113566 RepID=A0ABQ3ZNS0_9ACTN|nr:DUF4192 domain-containing protein [Actinoplanes humidus]GIE20153.1 hypothetical protein Ahu01nite_032550 [Actinoplanes humidus]